MELDIPDMFPASPFIRQQRSRRKRADYGSAPRYLHYDASERLRLLCYLSYPHRLVRLSFQCSTPALQTCQKYHQTRTVAQAWRPLCR